MKRLILTLCLLLSAANAWGQVDFGAGMSPQDKAEKLKLSIAKFAGTGKPLKIDNSTYDFGSTPYIFPPSFIGIGESQDGVVLQSSSIWTAKSACCFGLSNATDLENLTLEATCGDKQQSAIVGYADDSDKPRAAALRKVKAKGKAWSIYNWAAPDGNRLVIDDCDIYAAYVGINLGRSSGASAQLFEVKNSRIHMDPMLSSQGGSTTNATSGGVCGIVVRGGRLTVTNCFIEAIGPRPGYGPRLCAVADNLEGGSEHSVIEINGLTTKLTPGAETIRVDIDNTLAQPVKFGNGIAPNGGLLIRPNDLAK